MLDRRIALDPNLVFNAPLRQLDGATFMSRDQNGISCANSLAKWQLNSLLWDGADSIINCGKDLRIANIFDGGGTVSAWIKASSEGENGNGRIIEKRDGWKIYVREEVAGAVKLRIYVEFSTAYGYWTSSDGVVKIGVWKHVAISYDNGAVDNDPTIYVNGVPYTVGNGLTEHQAPVGTRVSDSGSNLYIGNTNVVDKTFDGSMTDMRLYDRILTGIEIQRIYNRTKRFFC